MIQYIYLLFVISTYVFSSEELSVSDFPADLPPLLLKPAEMSHSVFSDLCRLYCVTNRERLTQYIVPKNSFGQSSSVSLQHNNQLLYKGIPYKKILIGVGFDWQCLKCNSGFGSERTIKSHITRVHEAQ